MTLAVLTIIGVAALAFANGANDVSKGVATLAGTGRASYKAALAWGTLWTFAGGLAALVISFGLVKAFTSAIIRPDTLAAPTFPLAVAVGAFAWVMFASRVGLPVSTTHALTGAIVGVALVSGGVGAVRWPVLFATIAAPLALSPVVAAVIGYGVHALNARLVPACVCVETKIVPAVVDGGGVVAGVSATRLVTSREGCAAAEGQWRLMPASALHWGAAGALSFARGVNDNAKLAAIAGLVLSTFAADMSLALVTTAAAMTVGSYVAGFRVTRTLGERVVHMEQDTGLAAALVAAALVLAASFYTLPVSTTHVSTGAIVGAGLRQNSDAVEWRRLAVIATAWIVTSPVAAIVAGCAAWLFQGIV